MKTALVYDRVNKWGGAERVLLALHEIFPQAPLYTSIYEVEKAPWAKVFPKVYTSFLQKIPSIFRRHEWLAFLMPMAFESFDFGEYDLVISVTSEAAKGIITKPKTRHVCLCLTPTRYLWSGYEDYFQNFGLRFLSKPIINYLRGWDKVASQRPDYYIAISKEVQGRIKKYYGRDSIVVYPPVTLAGPAAYSSQGAPASLSVQGRSANADARLGSPLLASPAAGVTPRPFFLIVSRLVSYKRIDIVIEAFNRLGWPLKIVGTGSELESLKNRAKSNIEFLQNLTDEELIEYYEGCRAFVFAGVEDFGLSMTEAQLAGKPVIAYKKGGAVEIISSGTTGEFFEPQTADALIRVLKDFNDKDYKKEDCAKNAERFNKERFKKEFLTNI